MRSFISQQQHIKEDSWDEKPPQNLDEGKPHSTESLMCLPLQKRIVEKVKATATSNKRIFLEKSNYDPYLVRPSDLLIIKKHYASKFSLFISGETDEAQKVRLSILDIEREMLLGKFKYAYFIQLYYKYNQIIVPENQNQLLEHYMSVYRREKKSDRTDDNRAICQELELCLMKGQPIPLSETSWVEFNALIASSNFRKDMDTQIDGFVKKLETEIAHKRPLIANEYLLEVDFIQKKLKELAQTVGYIAPINQKLYEDIGKHCEVLIICPDKIIKPVVWLEDAASNMTRNDIYSVSLIDLVKYYNRNGELLPLTAQAGNDECATLGIMNLKCYIKNDQKILNEFTMCFSHYSTLSSDSEVRMRNFFFPAPHVLCYSQVSRYNKVIKAMLTSKEKFRLDFYDGAYAIITPIEQALKEAIEQAQKIDPVLNKKMILHNKKLLSELPDFREKWLKEYKLMMEKRHTLTDSNHTNRYLVYSTQRIHRYVALHVHSHAFYSHSRAPASKNAKEDLECKSSFNLAMES